MTKLDQIQKTMICLMSFILALEIYLVIANVTYVVFKLHYHLPPLLKYDVKARHYRCLAEFSRSAFLIVVTAYTALKVCYSGIFGKNTSRWPCNLYFRIPSLYLYVCLNCRALFAYGRLGLFQSCCNKPFVKEKIGFIVALVIMFAATMSIQALLDYDIIENVCFNLVSNELIVVCFIPFVTFEVASFILYYRPLRETASISVGCLEQCSTFLTTQRSERGNVQREAIDSSESSKPIFSSISISSFTQPRNRYTARSWKVSTNSKELVERFHKSVRRNFCAGLATVFIALFQVTTLILLDATESTYEFGISTDTRTWFWVSGFGQVVDKSLSVALYVSMILSESNWQRAFVPFLLCKDNSWDF